MHLMRGERPSHGGVLLNARNARFGTTVQHRYVIWCRICTMNLDQWTAVLALAGMLLAVGAIVLEMRGVISSKGKPYLLGVGIGSFLLMVRAFTLGEASFIVLEAIKTVAALSALVAPRSRFISNLAEDVQHLG